MTMTENPATWPDPAVPWRTADEPEWRKRVYSLGWMPRRNDGATVVEYILSGDCPRCGHPMAVSAGVAGVLNTALTETVRCNCDDPHPGRPDGKNGCGQRGNIPIP
jgi:hypothetical protein